MRYLLLWLLLCNVAWGLEPRQVVVGSPTATYYNNAGAKIGRSVLRNNAIEMYGPGGSFEGKITLDNPMQESHRGSPAARIQTRGNRVTIYDKSGSVNGWIDKGNPDRFYLRGAPDGWASTSGRTTTFYDLHGKFIGKKQ